MPISKFDRFLPYAGVLAGILWFGSMFSKYSEKYGDPNAAKIIEDNLTRNTLAVIAMGLTGVAVLFFAAAVRAAIRSGEGGESTYSSVAFGAAIALATSKAFDAMLLMAGIEAAQEADLTSLHALSYVGTSSWVPWLVASAAFFLAVGLGGLRTAALPKWLAITTVVLGVLCLLGPTGIAVYMVTPLWFVVTGVVLARRQPAQVEARVPVQV